MSLTSFIKIPEVRRKFAETFPKPPFQLDSNIIAKPLTKNYSLVGTAFDYLMRFYIGYLNRDGCTLIPKSIAGEWVAELAVMLLSDIAFFEKRGYSKNQIKEAFRKASDIVSRAKEITLTYQQTGNMTNDLLESAVCLAQLDPIFRAGKIDPNISIVDKEDVKDLRNLISVVDEKLFKAKRVCALNPLYKWFLETRPQDSFPIQND